MKAAERAQTGAKMCQGDRRSTEKYGEVQSKENVVKDGRKWMQSVRRSGSSAVVRCMVLLCQAKDGQPQQGTAAAHTEAVAQECLWRWEEMGSVSCDEMRAI